MVQFGNPIVGLEDLIRSAIKSPDFDINSETGVTGWRIARDGTATFNNLVIGNPNFTLNANGDLVVHSITLNAGDNETGITLHGSDIDPELYNLKARGVVSWTDLNGTGPVTTVTSDTIFARCILPDFNTTRLYRINGLVHINVNAVQPTYVGIRCRYAWDTDPSVSSPILFEHQWGGRAATATDEFSPVDFTFRASDLGTAGTDLHLVLTTFSSVAGINIQAEAWNRLIISDVGESIPVDVYDMGTGGGSPPTQYVKTYAANESASYQEDGSNRGVSSCYQGRYSATNGNQYSMIGFDDATIRSNLAGATINKVELYLNNNHFYSNSGGNAVIGTHNQTTLSGSHSSSQITDNIQQTHFDLGQAKWITIPNSIGNALRDNTAKGIALGPGPTTSQSYYGYFAGNGESGEPQLRITYTK